MEPTYSPFTNRPLSGSVLLLVLVFEVEDVFIEFERLRAAGVMPLSDKPRSLGRSLKNFFCLGPDEERLEFVQGTL